MFGAGPVPFGLHVKCGALSRSGQLAKVNHIRSQALIVNLLFQNLYIIAYDCIHEEPLVGDIDACEVFSGCGSVTAALKAI